MKSVSGYRGAAVVAVIAAASVASWVVPDVASASPVIRDGSSSTTAAASCWEIKKVSPSAPSGVYWLQTPELITPQEFYCDEETDGGGWVLIGRGRENWTFLYTGQGTAAAVARTPSGTAAFAPAALPSPTIDGLLNGGRVDQLSDGVRITRSRTIDGSSTSDARLMFANRGRWTWTIPAAHPLDTWSFSEVGLLGTSTSKGSGGTTANFGTDNAHARISTVATKAESYKSGFYYGTGVSGSTSSTSHIWQNNASGARPTPFSQVFLRPRLLSTDLSYPAIGDSGTPAQALRSMPEVNVLANSWGVGGLADGRDTVDTTEVRAIAQVGDRMIVGGNFAYVEQDGAGTGRVDQKYLAAFDVDTGKWLPSFRPTLDGQVERLIALPNGDIVVAGNFTTVNGSTSSPALVALNPVTGAIDTSWQVHLEQRSARAPLYARGLAISGDHLYIGGNFTHVSGGTSKTPQYSRSLARVLLTNGKPDTTWRPEVLGNINAIAPSADGSRVYVVGNYETIQKTTTAPFFTALATASGAALVPDQNPQFSHKNRYQQTVIEAGSRVWEGGSEHMLFSYYTSDMSLASTNIAQNKGDLQIVTEKDGMVYASCHCGQWLMSGARDWPNSTGWTEADSLEYIGAWDASTAKYYPAFVPEGIESRRELGAWALTFDSNGTLWAGGDFVSGRARNGSRVWTGAFQRFPARDSVPPTTPKGLRAIVRPDDVLRLAWTKSTDGSNQPIRYEVLAGDRVIADVGGPVADLPMPTTATRYFVRAIDKAGNRSASTAVLTYTP